MENQADLTINAAAEPQELALRLRQLRGRLLACGYAEFVSAFNPFCFSPAKWTTCRNLAFPEIRGLIDFLLLNKRAHQSYLDGLLGETWRVLLEGVTEDPRVSPHKPRKEEHGEGGLPGVDLGVERYAAGGSPGGGRTWESDPPPQDPLWPPLRGLEGPGRGGVVGETAPHTPPPYRASQGGSSGRRIGDFAVLEGEKVRFARRGPPPPKPQLPHRFGPQLASQVPGEGKNPGELAKVPGQGKKGPPPRLASQVPG